MKVQMQAVRRRQVHTKPRDGDVTSKCKNVLVNQKPEEEAEKAHYGKRLNNNRDVAQGGVMCVEM